MSVGVSESRFYMWRAIFAIAHADGQINKEEEAFMDEHMRIVSFSLPQRAILEDDIIHPKDPGEMLSRVSDPDDQGTFFQFARMMCWSDGNYDEQEKEIMQRLLGAHMECLDVPSMTQALSASKEVVQNQDKFSKEEKKGVGTIISRILDAGKSIVSSADGVSESRFYMWRAIFAMAHADDVITDEERAFMNDTLNTESFSPDQISVLRSDMDIAQDPLEMFMQIEGQVDRSHFFHFARLLCWSDGNFDEQEQKIMLKLKSIHVRNVDINEMIGHVDMELDRKNKDLLQDDIKSGNPFKSFLLRIKAS